MSKAIVKKPAKPTKKLEFQKLLALLDDVVSNPDENDLLLNKKNFCAHHEMIVNDQATKKPHTIRLTSPVLPCSSITCSVDEKSGRYSLYFYVDIYGNWPEDGNYKRGDDPIGDDLMDLLNGFKDRYDATLDSPPMKDIKKKIFLGTVQPEMNATAASRIKSPIRWPKHKEGHELEGEIDTSKSPQCKVHVFTQDINPETQVSPTDLLINGGTQKVRAEIYDRTVLKKPPAIKTEKDLFSNVVYKVGDTKLGKPAFDLNIQFDTLTPTWYWAKEKPAELQIKACLINVMDKFIIQGGHGMTTDDEDRLFKSALEAEQRYANRRKTGESPLKKVRVDNTDGQCDPDVYAQFLENQPYGS